MNEKAMDGQGPYYRITDDDIDDLRDRGCDESFLAPYAAWVSWARQIDPLIAEITEAFAGVTLGDGIGLLEAEAIDNYAGDAERARIRQQDEQLDWRRIPTETIGGCCAAPHFLDARGFVFHLPAFLIAELNDQYAYDFIHHLVAPMTNWRELLTKRQRDAVVAALRLVAHHPDHQSDPGPIESAIREMENMPEIDAE